jgi:lipid-binding SYLF domain-containing protein
MSFLQRLGADAKNACADLYGSMVMGDDAGKSLRFTLLLKPSSLPLRAKGPARIDLGMTFIEINGRAYVKSVAPGSVAARGGVLPQDAVQYATLIRPEWLNQAQHEEVVVDSERPDEKKNQVQDANDAEKLGITRDEDDGLREVAQRKVLDAESRGARTSYDDLRRLLSEAMDPTQSAFLSPPTSSKTPTSSLNPLFCILPGGVHGTGGGGGGPPIPSTVNICVPVRIDDEDDEDDGNDPSAFRNRSGNDSPYSRERPRPVIFVFRRTRQRKALHHLGLPGFRLDDECDFATSLVKRLAPTADMEIPPPDTWEELVHDGTDWLLGRGSILPPKTSGNAPASSSAATAAVAPTPGAANGAVDATGDENRANLNSNKNNDDDYDDPDNTTGIPLDEYESIRSRKMAQLRSRMAAEAIMHYSGDRSEDVEAVTIRGMIQKALGLAFVRASKVVLGVSLHCGSGIVLARLSDGTWSAPSAIGTWGAGFGIQFGLEVAEYIFILQTQEVLDHFKRGGSFTVGGNMGVAVAGVGREAYGAASLGGACGSTSTVNDDEYNDNDSRVDRDNPPQSVAMAPIVAYAKSQGLYVGVSLEGSRIYARDDINRRTYKFASGRDVTAADILSGRVATPREAEDLYAALHSVEFTHEMSCLPRPPEVLRKDSSNAWYYDKSFLAEQVVAASQSSSSEAAAATTRGPFAFLSSLSPDESEECEAFETQFKNFMYGGVSVQRLLPESEGGGNGGRTGKERRTLWLMLPEVGSLRLGFVSKLSDGEGAAVSNKSSTQRARRDDQSRFDGDVGTVGSEDVTLDSALNTRVRVLDESFILPKASLAVLAHPISSLFSSGWIYHWSRAHRERPALEPPFRGADRCNCVIPRAAGSSSI